MGIASFHLRDLMTKDLGKKYAYTTPQVKIGCNEFTSQGRGYQYKVLASCRQPKLMVGRVSRKRPAI